MGARGFPRPDQREGKEVQLILFSAPPPVFIPRARERGLVLRFEVTKGKVLRMVPSGKEGAEADVVLRPSKIEGSIDAEGITPAGVDFVRSFIN
jgi:hypothetical protein